MTRNVLRIRLWRSQSVSKTALRCALLFGNLLIFVGPGWSQEPATVSVRFEFKEQLIESLFKDNSELQQTENEISSDLAKICATRLRVWKYHPGQETDHPALNVWLRLVGGKWEVVMTLLVPLGGPRVLEWKADLLDPGETEVRGASTPHKPEYRSIVGRAFEDRLLTNNLDSIWSALSSQVTLGTALSLFKTSSGTGKAVLGLDWTKYCRDFADSEYLILAESTDGTRVELDSRGLPRFLSYTPEEPRFLGIGVRLNFWQAAGDRKETVSRHRTELAGLRPLSFKMKQYRVFSEACAVEKTSPAAVAAAP